MSQINIRNLSNENDDGSPEIVGVSTFSATSFFVPPKGSTAERPSDCEPGSIRFNTDTANLEYFRGKTLGWSQFELVNPNLGGGTGSNTGLGTRALFGGGGVMPAFVNTISFLTISTLGNSQDFGDMTYKGQFPTNGHVSSRSRGIFAGGYTPVGRKNHIDFITISSTGNAADFGDLTVNRETAAGGSNGTRGLFAGGFTNPNYQNIIDYVTIASTGDAVDFGDISEGRGGSAVCNSTRMVMKLSGTTKLEFITMSTTGNSTDFGTYTSTTGSASGDSSTRGIFAGNQNGNIIEFITTATLGNAQDFGDLTQARTSSAGTSSPTRMVIIGGGTGPSYPYTVVNTIDFVTIATTGNAVDFGDTENNRTSAAGLSNGHGGL